MSKATAIDQWRKRLSLRREAFYAGPYAAVVKSACEAVGRDCVCLDNIGEAVVLSDMLIRSAGVRTVAWRVIDARATPKEMATDPDAIVRRFSDAWKRTEERWR